jgi:hypothetical protein
LRAEQQNYFGDSGGNWLNSATNLGNWDNNSVIPKIRA